jgi:hypothetical protein
MAENLKLLRFYFWILALFTVGRWGLSFSGVEYSKAREVFSVVILALIASAHHAAFARAFAGYRFGQAVALGATIGFITQLVVWGSTALSYLLGMHTFWNASEAIARTTTPVEFGSAMVQRAVGLIANVILNSIAAAIGYAMGGGLAAATKK